MSDVLLTCLFVTLSNLLSRTALRPGVQGASLPDRAHTPTVMAAPTQGAPVLGTVTDLSTPTGANNMDLHVLYT